jgi:hypothetical protein
MVVTTRIVVFALALAATWCIAQYKPAPDAIKQISAIESIEHTHRETIDWLNKYVKGAR